MIDKVSVDILLHTIRIFISEMYPNIDALNAGPYSLDDIAKQVMFELIKEEYKHYAPRCTIQDYLSLFDVDAENRKYTRAIQYSQHYKDENNQLISDAFGFRLPELEAQDMSGQNVFSGHQFTEQEFLMYKMQAECRLLNKMHGHQIDSSKKVSESEFESLFGEYSDFIDDLEPAVNDIEHIIDRTYAYYGIETHFLTEFLYHLTLAAEKYGFPEEIPVNRILAVCGISPYIPAVPWCPEVFIADFCMIPKWTDICSDIFVVDNEQWPVMEQLLIDCKRIKNIILQRGLEKWIGYIHQCPLQEKVNFILEQYWLWDIKSDFEWTPERIRYYRKLYRSVTRTFSKPHVN